MCTVSTSAIACQILFCIDSYLCLYLLLSFHVFDKLVKNCNHKVSTWAGYSQIFSMCTSECTSDISNEKLCICYCAWIRICLCTFVVFLTRVLASHVVLPTRLLPIYLLPSTVTRPSTFTNYIETTYVCGANGQVLWSSGQNKYLVVLPAAYYNTVAMLLLQFQSCFMQDNRKPTNQSTVLGSMEIQLQIHNMIV